MTVSLAASLGRHLPESLRDDPAVSRLAAYVSSASFVPFVLLRDVRREMLPHGGLTVEARLCESDLVESVAADGFVLHGGAREELRLALRAALAENDVDPDLARLRSSMHNGLELLSPLLRLEERVVWQYITEADYLDACDRELGGVVRGITQERRLRMLEWASAAMTRLPQELLGTPSAWLLAQLCRAQDLPHPQLGWPEGANDEGLFLEVMHFLPQTVVGVARDGIRLTLGPVSAQRPIGVRVPATQPVSVRVKWPGNPDGRVISDVDRTVKTVASGAEPVTIVGLDGRAVQLGAMNPNETAPELREQQRVFDRLEDARIRRRELMAKPVHLDVGPHGYLVRLSEEASVTAYMPVSAAKMPGLTESPGLRVPTELQRVRVTQVDRERQRVSVSRVRGIVSRGSLVEGQLVRARITAKTLSGLLLDLTGAAGLAVPQYERVFGLLGTQDLPASPGWMPKYRSARSYAIEEGMEVDVVVTTIDGSGKQLRVTVRLADRSDVPGGRLPDGLSLGQRLWGTVAEKFYHGVRFDIEAQREDAVAEPYSGIRGLVLNTELSWDGRWFYGGGDAREFGLVVGDRCELVVVGVHELTGEVALSLKQVVEDPGRVTLRMLRPGSEVDGIVMRRVGDVWRVRLEPWSAMTTVPVGSFKGRLKTGTRIRMRVRHSDPATHTISAELVRVHADGG
ncbi:hypothetical protein ACWDX8_03410 [Streptomyces anthocyanicus]|uniref:hypothetical protein n=1 Tax=Streptomyces TaxID=1883 RepID=UPI00177FF013|nr:MULTISPECIES: hypothetical protein [Streptomyces]MBQ0947883.1 hypothetical protein [Streptomyces sp. RK76]MDX3346428.1 hypothetical protein [Streptomyces sp. ME02-6979A]WTC51117.1 hypothetical protein OG855_26725 [Streptomyces anthocyanicus]GHA44341.1 hypothetical protein GCM10010391_30750 [Streptomyces anthocyanicus]